MFAMITLPTLVAEHLDSMLEGFLFTTQFQQHQDESEVGIL